MQEIESLWYQKKITGYGQNGPFPTEMTATFIVGETAYINNKPYVCEKIVKEKTGFKVYFEKNMLLIPLDTKPEILYSIGNSEDKTE